MFKDLEMTYSNDEYIGMVEDAAQDRLIAARQFEDEEQYHTARAFSHPQDAKAKHSQWWLKRYGTPCFFDQDGLPNTNTCGHCPECREHYS